MIVRTNLAGLLLALPLMVALPLVAQTPTTAEDLVANVEKTLEAGDAETAAEWLVRAEVACAALPSGLLRSRLIGRLKPPRARLGKNVDLFLAAQRDAARVLVTAAERYAGRSWHATAADLLDEVRRLDPDVAARTRRPPKPDASRIGVGNQLATLFAPTAVELPYGGDPWVLGTEVVSPRLGSRETTAIFSRVALQGEYEAQARLAVPATTCKFSLAFGYQAAAHSYYLVELVQGPRRSDLRVYSYQNDSLRRLGETTFPTTALRQLGGEIAVAVTAQGVRASAGGVSLMLGKEHLPHPTDGGLGFLISGDTPFPGSMTVEALRVDQR